MENYYWLNKKALISFGISFKREHGWFEKPLKVFTGSLLLVAIVQNALFIAQSDGFSFLVANAISISLCSLAAVVKFFSIVWYQDELTAIEIRLKQLLEDLDDDKRDKVVKKLLFYPKLSTSLVKLSMSCSWIFNIMPGVKYIVSYIRYGVPVEVLPYAMWYPFEKYQNFLLTYVYEIICGHVWTLVPLILDGLLLLLMGQFVVLFENLGEEFKEAIDQPECSSRNIVQLIDYHNLLLDLCKQTIHIFEIPMLSNVLTQSGLICFSMFIISIEGIDIIIPSLLGTLTCLGQIYMLCWIGENIMSSSSDIANQINNSNLHQVERKDQKNLMMVVLRSQKALDLKASKFFRLKFTLFIKVIRTAFSYFTLVQHVYSVKED